MRRRPLCLLCLLFIFILCIANLFGASFSSPPKGAEAAEAFCKDAGAVRVAGRVRSCKTQGKNTDLILEDTWLTRPEGESLPLGGIRISLGGSPHFAVGARLLVSGSLTTTEAPTNPGQFDQKFYLRLQGIHWHLKKALILSASPSNSPFPAIFLEEIREALALLGQSMTDRIREFFPENAAGILAAMITGDKSLLSDESRELYRLGGVSHILAISGLHITLLGVGFYQLLRKLRLPLRASGLLAALFLIAYAILTGGSVATLRALIMFLLYLLSKAAFRVYDVPTALAVAAILLLLENPLYLFYAGFQLSFTAVLALAAFPGHGRFFSGLILYLITVPFTLWHYFSLPLYGVFVNLLVVPLMPFVLGFGLFGLLGSCLLGVLGLAVPGSLPIQILTAPAVWLLERVEQLLKLTQTLPFASLPLGRPCVWQLCLYVLFLAVFLYFLKIWRRTYRKYALLLALPLLFGIFFLRKTDFILGLALCLSVIFSVCIVKCRFRRFRAGRSDVGAFRSGRALAAAAGIRLKRFPLRFFLGFSVASFLLITALIFRPEGNLVLSFLDVGQGDGIFLDFPEGKVLVDGGSSSLYGVGKNRLEPFFAYSGAAHLDYIAATHADSDHISGIREILEDVRDHLTNFSVGTLLLPKTKDGSDALKDLEALARASGTRVLYVSAGDFIEIGKARLDILGPDLSAETSPLDENAQCIVLGVHYGSFDALLTGDVQGEGEKCLLNRLEKAFSPDPPTAPLYGSPEGASGVFDVHRLDVLKVAHHGSKYSTPAELLSLASPKVAVLSCGRNNSYGHPHEELLARLEAAGTRVYRTDVHGAIFVEVNPAETGFTVTTFLSDK